MKIIEEDDDFIKFFSHKNHIEFHLYTQYGPFISSLTPLEAHQLGTLLLKLASETDYFQGFKKDE